MIKSRLKVLMAEREITQEELAKELKIDRKFIIALGNGKTKSVNITNLKKLVDFFHCTIQDLIYFDDNKNQKSPG